MNQTFVKYCPLCDAENLSIASFCDRCDGDLMNAPVVPRRETGAAEPEAEPHVPTSIPVPPALIVRGPNQESLATRRAADYQPSLQLELVENPAISFKLRPGQTVGRADKADVVLHGVPHLDFISRAHARFLHRRGQWYVQYIAEGNFIKVDGSEYSDDSEVAIFEDSVVVLSLTAFRIHTN